MDLGLGELTDDQLLELLEQACVELTRRDPYVRDLAQHTITTQGERHSVWRRAADEAIAQVRKGYVERIRQEAFNEISDAVAKGTISLLTSEQEARVAVESGLEAKIKLIDETAAAIQQGKRAKEVEPEPLSEPRYDPRSWETDRQRDPYRTVPINPKKASARRIWKP